MSQFGHLVRLLCIIFLTINFTAGAPAAPTNVRISQFTCTSVTVSWDGVDEATGYSVEWMLINNRFRAANGLRTVSASINSITVARLLESSQYSVEVTSIQNGVLGGSTLVTFASCTEGRNNNENTSSVVTNSTSSTTVEPIDQVNSTEPIDQVNSTKAVGRTIKCNGTVLVAPVNLTAKIISGQMLMISWSYPSSLLSETIFEVTYSLVSAYNTSAGMKSFAEYDEFNTTQTLFYYALVSPVTNYIFTVTPYSATHAGDSARVIVNDFSEVDLVEDPVIFFNLRLSSRTANSLSSSDINKINSDLTRHIQSSINDACQCTLPSYTLRGSIDSCNRPQLNCAIYTGRLLGSDTASATEVFEMVEEWLATQNGSLLNDTLSVDPDCPLRLLSPSDTACSTWSNISSPRDNANDDDTTELTLAQLLAIAIASGVITVIICFLVIVSALYVRRSRKPKKDDLLTFSTYALPLVKQDDQRHYSVVVQKNPSYDPSLTRPHLNHSTEMQNAIFNGNTIDSHSDPQQEETQSAFETIQPIKPRNASEATSTGYVEIYSSGEYCNADNITPDSLSALYLSVTQT